MNCPNCNCEMVEGTAKLEVGGNFWNRFFYGRAAHVDHLFFEGEGVSKRSVIAPGSSRSAYRCSECRGIFIAQLPAPFQQLTADFGRCGECGIPLKPDYPGCHWCGWQPKEQPKGE